MTFNDRAKNLESFFNKMERIHEKWRTKMTHPEDVRPMEIWKLMNQETRRWFKREFTNYKSLYPVELVRVKVWEAMNDWYEWTYQEHLHNLGELQEEVFKRDDR